MFIQKYLLENCMVKRMLLVIVVLITCCEVKANEKDDYHIQSIDCKKFDESIQNGQLCEDNIFFLWKVYCRYECYPSGDFKKTNCKSDQIGLKEYPLCDDLHCARKKQGTASEQTTESVETTTE